MTGYVEVCIVVETQLYPFLEDRICEHVVPGNGCGGKGVAGDFHSSVEAVHKPHLLALVLFVEAAAVEGEDGDCQYQ